MKKVLMIDDDQSLCERLVKYFSQFAIDLIVANTPSKGLQLISEHNPDLLLLDVMMPEKDGFTLCRELRAYTDIPIIMLTARGDLTDKVLGLEIGADDYLSKPFEPRELIARVEVLLRRNKKYKRDDECWHFGELEIFPTQHKALLNKEALNLTGMEFNLLKVLARKPGQVFNRDELLNELRGIDTDIYSRSIDILLSRLRNKLGDEAQRPKYIKTLRNIGYTFIAKSI